MKKIPSAGIVALTFLLLLFANPTSAQWVRTNGPYGWDVKCLAAAGPKIYAGTYSGVFRSTNNGETWESASSGLSAPYALGVYCIIAAPDFLLAGLYGGGIFRSTDNGSHWVAADVGLPPVNEYGFLPSPYDLAVSGTTVFAGIMSNGNGGGVYYSTNGGTSWVATNNGLTNPYTSQPFDVYALAVADSVTVYAGTGLGVYKSTNKGANWLLAGKKVETFIPLPLWDHTCTPAAQCSACALSPPTRA